MNIALQYVARPKNLVLHSDPKQSKRFLAVQSLWQRGSATQINEPSEESPLADPPVPDQGHDPDEIPPTYDALADSAPVIEPARG